MKARFLYGAGGRRQRSTGPSAHPSRLPECCGLSPPRNGRDRWCGAPRSRRLLQRHGDEEGIAARTAVVQPDLPTHALHQLAGEVEADAEAAALAEQGVLHLVERREHALDLAVGDAPAVVAPLDVRLVDDAERGDLHGLVVRGELEGVVDEAGEDEDETLLVDVEVAQGLVDVD